MDDRVPNCSIQLHTQGRLWWKKMRYEAACGLRYEWHYTTNPMPLWLFVQFHARFHRRVTL